MDMYGGPWEVELKERSQRNERTNRMRITNDSNQFKDILCDSSDGYGIVLRGVLMDFGWIWDERWKEFGS